MNNHIPSDQDGFDDVPAGPGEPERSGQAVNWSSEPPIIDDDPHDGDPPPENPIYS